MRAVKCVRHPHRVAVDVGAHIGIWSKVLAEQGFEVHAFEPTAENYECLRENTAHLPVRAYPFGLSSRSFKADLYKGAQDNSGMWRIEFASVAGDPGAAFETLDSQGLEDVGLIKIDVEGHEGSVLLGATKTIQRSRPVIVFEDNGVGPKYEGAHWVEPKRVLLGLGYIRQARVRKDEIWLPG